MLYLCLFLYFYAKKLSKKGAEGAYAKFALLPGRAGPGPNSNGPGRAGPRIFEEFRAGPKIENGGPGRAGKITARGKAWVRPLARGEMGGNSPPPPEIQNSKKNLPWSPKVKKISKFLCMWRNYLCVFMYFVFMLSSFFSFSNTK